MGGMDIPWLVLASAGAMVGMLLPACGAEVIVSGTPAGGAGGVSSSTTSTGGTTSTTSTSTGTGGSGLSGDDSGVGGEPCPDYVEPAVPTQRPLDIIYLIDNSGSMGDELYGVEQNINVNFAQIIGQANIDYRVIMVTDHGVGYTEVCIGPPLGTGTCASAPGEVPNQFYHYDVNISSHDSLCVLLDTLHGPNGGGQADQHGMYPNGWVTALRPEAFKVIVEITDDGIEWTPDGTQLDDMDQIAAGQTVAVTFDQMLLQASPAQFGAAQHRTYRWHAVLDLPYKGDPLVPSSVEPYYPAEQVVVGTCQSYGGTGPGTGYQWLAKGTGGLRIPVCEYVAATFDALFQDLSADIIATAEQWCELELPQIPNLNPDGLSLIYTPDDGSPEEWPQVASQAACGTDDERFYIENSLIKACPAACARLDGGPNGELLVKVSC